MHMLALKSKCTSAVLVLFAMAVSSSSAGATTVAPKDAGVVLKKKMGSAIETVLQTILIKHPCMTLAVAFIFLLEEHMRHFHKRKWIFGHVHGRSNGIMRKLGIDMIIITIYYGSESVPFVNTRPFVLTLLIVSVDTFAMYYIGKLIHLMVKCQEFSDELVAEEDDDVDPYREYDEGVKFQATSKYMHIALPLRRVIPVFFAQMSIMLFYMFYLNADKDSHDVKNVSFLYWIVAIVLQLYAGEQQLGDPYCPEYWNTIEAWEEVEVKVDTRKRSRVSVKEIEFMEKAEVVKVEHDQDGKIYKFNAQELTIRWEIFSYPVPMPLKYELRIRRFMDCIINRFLREVVVFTFPIMLCVEGPLDFVKDCTAIWFITTLDDLDVGQDDKTKIPDMLGKVFKRWAWDKVHRKSPSAREPRRHKKVADHAGYERLNV